MKSMIIKSVLALMSILMSASTVLADSLYIEPFSMKPGETKEISICLTNTQQVTAIQAEIYLSDGLELVKQGEDWITMTDRASGGHSIIVNHLESEAWTKFICFSNTNTPFTGTEGSLINMTVKASESFTYGSIGLDRIKLSDLSHQDIIVEACWISVECVIPVERIVLDSEVLELKIGESFYLNPTVYPENATDKSVVWTSNNESVATVDGSGYVSAVGVGSSIITAKCGDVSASCEVSVKAPAVESVILSNYEAKLRSGETLTLIASVYPENAADKEVFWSSSNTEVAVVDDIGNVTAKSVGWTEISASCGSITASCIVTVMETPVESVTISQQTAQLKVGEGVALTATVLPEDATDKTVIWNSDNEAVATVDANGNVTAVGLGTATITASCGNYTASCVVTVISTPVESVTISQQSAQLKVGEGVALIAEVLPIEATDRTVVWNSDNEAVATVDANGNVTAVSLGIATITASCGNYTASCVVTVIATPVESVTISQQTAQLKVGEGVALIAEVLPIEATDRTVIWNSDNEAVATVDANGNVTAVSLGTSTITASCGNYTASCVVTVIATPVESVTISQQTAELKVGEGVALSAEVLPIEATDRTVVWRSDNEAVASVDANGYVTAGALGTATITASCGNYSAACVVTVIATPVESIQLTPDNWKGIEGESFSISAMVLPEEATEKSVIWTSSDESVATVDAEGNVSVLKEGSCAIRATAADGSGAYAECVINSTSGVEDLYSDSDRFDIYDLNGIQVKKEADREDLKMLTPGIYIIRCGAEMKKLIVR